MQRIAGVAIILGCVLFLGACTPMRWEKEGVAVDAGNEDWTACKREAVLSAARWNFSPFPRAYISRDPRGQSSVIYRNWPNSDRFMLEQDYMNACMRQRGYQLLPVKPETG